MGLSYWKRECKGLPYWKRECKGLLRCWGPPGLRGGEVLRRQLWRQQSPGRRLALWDNTWNTHPANIQKHIRDLEFVNMAELVPDSWHLQEEETKCCNANRWHPIFSVL